MIKKLIQSTVIIAFIQLSSCAVLVKDTEMYNIDAASKVSDDTVYSTKYIDKKIKNIAIFGFSSNLFTGSRQNNQSVGIFSAISEAASQRGCIALNRTYVLATSVLKSNGFVVLPQEKLAVNNTFNNIGIVGIPGVCTSGKTRINIFPPTKEMNQLFDELGVDSILTFNVNAENDFSNQAIMQLWTKGDKEAKLAWTGGLKRTIKVESDTSMFFYDIQDFSRSDEKKISLTYKVFSTAFKLLYTKMIKDIT